MDNKTFKQVAKKDITTQLFIDLEEASYEPNKDVRQEKLRLLAYLITHLDNIDV